MSIEALGQLLSSTVIKERLHVSLPLQAMSFAEDNVRFLSRYFQSLERSEELLIPLIVRQFTALQSEVPYPNDPSRYLPIKRLAGFRLYPAKAGVDQVEALSKADLRNSFCVDAKTGEPIPPSQDVLYEDGDRMLGRLRRTMKRGVVTT